MWESPWLPLLKLRGATHVTNGTHQLTLVTADLGIKLVLAQAVGFIIYVTYDA